MKKTNFAKLQLKKQVIAQLGKSEMDNAIGGIEGVATRVICIQNPLSHDVCVYSPLSNDVCIQSPLSRRVCVQNSISCNIVAID